MFKYHIAAIAILLIVFSSTSSIAKDKVNTETIANEGFGAVSEIFNQMTPEQQEEVYKKAMEMMEEVKKMSPSEIEALKNQMLDMQNSIDFDSINIEKLDTTKDLDLKTIQKDIKTYKKQRQ